MSESFSFLLLTVSVQQREEPACGQIPPPRACLGLNYHEKTTRNNGKLIRVPKIRLQAARKAFIFKVQASTINYLLNQRHRFYNNF